MPDAPRLLTRDQFRDQVFARDDHCCVFCSAPARDAHHILERRLWPDGGYYLDNGASVCEEHHLACEMTTLSIEEVRAACKIDRVLVPPHLYPDQPYDKWGNPILPDGRRLRGELFGDESVQKVLRQGGVLDLFTQWVKYPRTYHLPWSQSIRDDDRVTGDLSVLEGREVIVTEKMDGENITLYRDHLHARSLDGRHHPSQSWVKQFWSKIAGDIPQGWRVCVENLYAEHSIHYASLPAYCMGFSVWDDTNTCLHWDETREWLDLLGIPVVRELYRGPFHAGKIQALWSDSDWARTEGYVVRAVDAFHYGQFRHHVAKFVRPHHLQTEKHWRHGRRVVANGLAP